MPNNLQNAIGGTITATCDNTSNISISDNCSTNACGGIYNFSMDVDGQTVNTAVNYSLLPGESQTTSCKSLFTGNNASLANKVDGDVIIDCDANATANVSDNCFIASCSDRYDFSFSIGSNNINSGIDYDLNPGQSQTTACSTLVDSSIASHTIGDVITSCNTDGSFTGSNNCSAPGICLKDGNAYSVGSRYREVVFEGPCKNIFGGIIPGTSYQHKYHQCANDGNWFLYSSSFNAFTCSTDQFACFRQNPFSVGTADDCTEIGF